MEAAGTTDIGHTSHSSTREKVLEHLFVGELLRCLWRRGSRDIEVLRAEVDKGGYDLVLEANGVLRHVQLKSSHRTAATREVGVNVHLARKPCGCVIWIQFDPGTMELGPFLWFGAAPSSPLPPLGERLGRHTKADSNGVKAERPNIRLLRKSQFEVLPDMDAVAQALFGAEPCQRSDEDDTWPALLT